MHVDSAPFPLDTELRTATRNSFAKTTEADRGQTLLAHFLHGHGDDQFTEPGGLKRFNTGHAVPTAAALIRDVLTYVHQHAGGTDAVARTISALHELAEIDHAEAMSALNETGDIDHTEYRHLDGGVIGGLTVSLTDRRLTQIRDSQSKFGIGLKDLAAHLGVQVTL
ncbi:hypothetical protein ACFV1U_37455 [Streptomyces microflavus]|uniref:hypothetical protein n=1 Tax=Streptomyces microflavus TaxID=1919 RepID=UPI0036B99EF1